MCSISESMDDLSLSSTILSSENSIVDNCKKCRSQPAEVVLMLKDAVCRNCLLLFVNHKFRACLGRSKLVKPKEKLLVPFSGSMTCATLLDLIHCGLSDTTPKRIMFSPLLVYIDDGAALKMNNEKRGKIFHDIKLMLTKYGLPAFYVPLESIINFKFCDILSFNSTVTARFDDCVVRKFQEMFDDVKSITSKEDLLRNLRQNLLIQVAEALKCTKILTSETSTDLATKLISNVVIGRGAHLSLDVGFCDSRCSAVQLLRPLQDISKKAVVFYVYFKKLKSIFIPTFSTMESITCSIQKLTENFLVGLQSEFPSTMSTIFRTGEKLSLNPMSQSFETRTCVLCQAPQDVSLTGPSAFQATRMSSIVSKYGKDATNNEGMFTDIEKEVYLNEQCCEKGGNDLSCSNSNADLEVEFDKFLLTLCYGCQLTLKEAKLAGSLLRTSEVILSQTK